MHYNGKNERYCWAAFSSLFLAARVAESSFDDVIVFVLVFVSALLLIFIGCSAYKIKLWFRGQHAGVGKVT